MNDKNFNIKGRVTFIYYSLLFLFIIIIIKLFIIQIIQHERWKELAFRQYFTQKNIIGKRGGIKAYNGEELAYDIESYDIQIDPMQIRQELIPDYSRFISRRFEIKFSEILEIIEEQRRIGSRYYIIAKEIMENEKEEIITELRRLGISRGIYFVEKNKRVYTKQNLFQHITGYLNYDRFGVYGIEMTQNSILQPKQGYIRRYVAGHLNFEPPTSKISERLYAEDGYNAILTVDYVMQHILFEELQKMYNDTEANWVTGIILEAKTGKIKAMTSLPISEQRKNIKNLNISNVYEPGSVFKPIVMAMAYEEKLVNDDDRFVSEGQIRVYDRIIREHNWSVRGEFSPTEVIAKSSNVSMVQVGDRFTKQQFYRYLDGFGLTQKTGINFPGEVKGIVPHYTDWSGLTLPTMTFGQGIAITPLQMAMAFAAVVNGGYLYSPIILDRVEDNNGNIIKQNTPQEKNRVISKEVSDKMRMMLYETVENGTGTKAKIDGYKIGGKTGTSQKSVPNKGYVKGKYHSSFAGFFPLDDPEYVCLIVIDEPKGDEIYGGQIGAPVFREAFKRIIKYKGYIPENIDKEIIQISDKIEFTDRIEEQLEYNIGYMPDLEGKSKREVLKILGIYNNELVIKGSGLLIEQSPEPGKRISKDDKFGLLFQ